MRLTVAAFPKNAENKKVKWESSNKKYAVVDQTGTVTLKKAGAGKTVKITATATDGSGEKVVFPIRIMKNSVRTVRIKTTKRHVRIGKKLPLKVSVTVTGKNANKKVKWKSSNTKYATVSGNGTVTAKKAGKGKTVTITAYATDGSNKKSRIKIKIQ